MILAASEIDAIKEFCSEDRDKYGLFLPLINIAGNYRAQVRTWLGLTFKELHAKQFFWSRDTDTTQPLVIIDAWQGNRHAAIWFPVARKLMEANINVGFVSPNDSFPSDVLADKSIATFLRTEITNPATARFRQTPQPHPIPWGGLFGRVVKKYLYLHHLRVAAWQTFFQQRRVRLLLTTLPCFPWINSLIRACGQHNIQTVSMCQGIPSAVWGFPSTDLALVWSRLGESALQNHGWNDRTIIIAKNPSIPSAEELAILRSSGRKRLGLDDKDYCLLIIGQLSSDQVFQVKGYHATCAIIARGVAQVADPAIVPVLRPHYRDSVGETERILNREGIPLLKVSQGAPLMEDIALADIVISMHSSAMEEAYLAGKTIIQVNDESNEPMLDFRIVNAPLVSNVNALADLLRRKPTQPAAIPAAKTIPGIVTELMEA